MQPRSMFEHEVQRNASSNIQIWGFGHLVANISKSLKCIKFMKTKFTEKKQNVDKNIK